MKTTFSDRNYLSSYILIIVATVLLLIIAITDRKDITSAAVVISAMILFLTGIFLFTFAKKESVDDHICSLLPVQNQVNICRIAADLGIMGNAWFLPGDRTGESRIMQFMPVSTYLGGELDGNSFVSGPGGTGILLPPAGEALMSDLRKTAKLTIPDSLEEILILIPECGKELLEIAGSLQAEKTGEGIAVVMDGYLLIEGCRKISTESPACCSMNPCPICSLFGMMIAEGLNQAVTVERCRPDKKEPRVEILFTLLSK